jgi:hypothetical protein
MMLSTMVLLLGGVIRGLVPAMRASKPDPVEVLRYEYRRCRVIPWNSFDPVRTSQYLAAKSFCLRG